MAAGRGVGVTHRNSIVQLSASRVGILSARVQTLSREKARGSQVSAAPTSDVHRPLATGHRRQRQRQRPPVRQVIMQLQVITLTVTTEQYVMIESCCEKASSFRNSFCSQSSRGCI